MVFLARKFIRLLYCIGPLTSRLIELCSCKGSTARSIPKSAHSSNSEAMYSDRKIYFWILGTS